MLSGLSALTGLSGIAGGGGGPVLPRVAPVTSVLAEDAGDYNTCNISWQFTEAPVGFYIVVTSPSSTSYTTASNSYNPALGPGAYSGTIVNQGDGVTQRDSIPVPFSGYVAPYEVPVTQLDPPSLVEFDPGQNLIIGSDVIPRPYGYAGSVTINSYSTTYFTFNSFPANFDTLGIAPNSGDSLHVEIYNSANGDPAYVNSTSVTLDFSVSF